MKKGVVVVLAVAIAAALGFFAQRRLQPSDGRAVAPVATAPTASTAGNQSATAPDTASAEATAPAKPTIPEMLPQFELKDRDGTLRRLDHWKGRPLLINYWATWCAPCRREIPLLNKVRAERAKQKLEVVGIAVDFRDDVLKYATETTISYPLLIGEEDGLVAVSAVGMQPQFPFTVFADSQQHLVALKIGELHQEEIDLILDRIVAIDAGKLELAVARSQITEGLKNIATRRAAAEAAKPST